MASGGSGTYSQWQHCVWKQLGKQEARQGTAWPDLRSEDHFESEASLNCSVKPCLRKKSGVWWLVKNDPHRCIDLNVQSPENGLDGGSVSLGVGFEVSGVQVRPRGSLSSCCLRFQMENSQLPCLPVCHCAPCHENNG